MSKFNLLLLIALLFTTVSQAQTRESGISSEGPDITKVIDLPAFTGIKASNSGNINITQGSQSFEVTAASNIIDNLELIVKNNVLHIGFKKSMKRIKTLNFNISMPSIHELTMTGSGNIFAKGFDTQKELYLSLTGSGNMNVDNGASTLSAKLSGSGNINVSGKADTGTFNVTGSGNIRAKDLVLSGAEAKVTGSGGIAIACNDQLNANITGSGSIDVYGNPNIKSRVTGSGKLNEHN